MDADRIARLTDAEKACLRLVLRHSALKDIARSLGISPDAARERLRKARAKLGVSRSLDAAILLAKQEGADYTLRDYTPDVVAQPGDPAAFPPPIATGREEQSGRQGRLREDQAPYGSYLHSSRRGDPDLPLRIPILGGTRDDLRTWQIICFCVLVGALAIAAVAALVKVEYEVFTNDQLPDPQSNRH